MATTDEQKIIQGCLENDRVSQKKLYDEYSSALYAVCCRYVPSKEEAEEVLLDGFMKIYQNIGSYKGVSSLFSWMKSIMVKTAIDRYRSILKFSRNVSVEDVIVSDDFVVDEKVTARIDAHRVMNIIESMSDEWRLIFNMHVVEGFSLKEIAKELNKNENTVRVYFLRARKWLLDKIENDK